MFRDDAIEATPIVMHVLDALLQWAPTRGRSGADLRSAVGNVKAHTLQWLRADIIGGPLAECFELARLAGVSLAQMAKVRSVASAEPAVSVGAITMRDGLVELSLATEGRIIADTIFVSRQDAEQMKLSMNAAFAEVEEATADAMDAMTYRAIVSLHAAVTFHLIETARPLPRMLNFAFGQPMSTLLIAHRLYADAGRADELRAENKVVHPAFARPYGRALSS